MKGAISLLLTAICLNFSGISDAAEVLSGGAGVESYSQTLEQSQTGDPAVQWLDSMKAAASFVQEAARTFYVSPTGSNSYDGSQQNPWRSIQHGVSQLQAGDTLYVMEGGYAESAVFSASGTADAPITVEGIGNAVIDGAALVNGRLAVDPIRDDPDLQGIVSAVGNKSAYHVQPAFSTNGHSHLRFKNLSVNRMRAAVEVTAGSSFVLIDGIRTDGNRFAVRISDATDVTVRNSKATNSWNAFRAEGQSRRLLFENTEAYGSKDIWDGMSADYLNGDGFILETEVSDAVLRHVVTGNHWDGGFDIKASNVRVDFAVSYGNKNNFKIWGTNVLIENSLGYGACAQKRSDGTLVEGNGLTAEVGAQILLRNVTLADNQGTDVRLYQNSNVVLEDGIVARKSSSGGLFAKASGAIFRSTRVLWYAKGRKMSAAPLSATDSWGNPRFLSWSLTSPNYRLSTGSWAWGRAPGGWNLGAYAFQILGLDAEEPGLTR